MSSFSGKIRRVRFWYHLTAAYVSRYKARISIISLLILLSSYALIKLYQTMILPNSLSIGYAGSYEIDTIPSEIFSPVTKPLIAASQDGKPQADLASHWTVADDGKTYIIFLKDNIKWHDSSQLSAEDLSIAIENVSITAVNNKTIEFKLPNSIVSFPLFLDRPVFKANSFYGTGEYRIVDIEEVNGIIKKIAIHPKNNKLPRIILKFYPAEDLLLQALKIGEVKVGYFSNQSNTDNFPNLEITQKIDYTKMVTIFYNNNDNTLSSKDARQALNYALQTKRFSEKGVAVHSPIQATSWVYSQDAKRYDYDLKKAKELFEKANVDSPRIVLSYTQELEDVAKLVAEDWKVLGIQVELKKEKNIPKSFQALLVVNKLEADPDQYALWHSTQKSTNITAYKNVKIDKILEDARIEQDESKRKDLYSDFQKFLTEDASAAFLYHPNKYLVSYKNARELVKKISPFEKGFQ